MNIAIVDDVERDRKILRHMLEDEYPEGVNITEYESGEAFLEEFSAGHFATVFLDIYMDGINGMDAAKEIYKTDENCRIVFLTTSEDFGVLSYSVRAADYIVKPITLEALKHTLKFCIPKPKSTPKTVTFIHNRNKLAIEFSRIMYVDMVGRNVCVHLQDMVLSVSGKFAGVTAPLLEDNRFMICFKGVAVNLEYVAETQNDCLILKNLERIPVSRRYKKQILKAFLSFVSGNLRGEAP